MSLARLRSQRCLLCVSGCLLIPADGHVQEISPLPSAMPRVPKLELHSTLVGHSLVRVSAPAPRLTFQGVAAVRFSPDGSYLASGGAEGMMLLYAIEDDGSIAFVRAFDGHTAGINDLEWSPDSRLIATASDDRSIRVWDVDGGQMVKLLRGHTSFVFCLAWSPDGYLLASGSFDESVRLWDVFQGRCLRSTPGHADPVSAVAFSPDATMIASGGHDGIIRFWDTSTGQCLLTLGGDTNPPVCVDAASALALTSADRMSASRQMGASSWPPRSTRPFGCGT